MGMIREEDVKYLEQEFSKHLKDNVDLVVFTSSSGECKYCKETVELATEVAAINNKIELKVYDFDKDKDAVEKYQVSKYPATIVSLSGDQNGRIKYYGIPSGYEFGSLIEDLKVVSNGDSGISSKAMEIISKVDKPVKIKVYVTPTCPYCPRAVGTAHKFAMVNSNIQGEMIESSEFYSEAEAAGVSAVPHIVINDSVQFQGALPDEAFAEYVMEAYKQI
ncbi:MAG: thioredoxin family protein [Candidatus Thermoplasmatota archaeon]|jgi:glutaredoxin-like protein|nr:thioredoxin family protein [Candidatus Thermoplasmatota archaeon]MCL5794057.1 thioredoxin family protein [Candidatus Thermoplasmatota archaeon]